MNAEEEFCVCQSYFIFEESSMYQIFIYSWNTTHG